RRVGRPPSPGVPVRATTFSLITVPCPHGRASLARQRFQLPLQLQPAFFRLVQLFVHLRLFQQAGFQLFVVLWVVKIGVRQYGFKALLLPVQRLQPALNFFQALLDRPPSRRRTVAL